MDDMNITNLEEVIQFIEKLQELKGDDDSVLDANCQKAIDILTNYESLLGEIRTRLESII